MPCSVMRSRWNLSRSMGCNLVWCSASDGRMIDNIVTNSILPAFSRGILGRQIAREPVTEAVVSVADGEFAYEVK